MRVTLLLLCKASACLALSVNSLRGRVTAASLRMSWTDANWNWGSTQGLAHEEALRLTTALSTPEQRGKFLTGIGMMDPEDFADSKIVLALNIQRAAKRCYAADYGLDPEEQLAWQALMDEMAACRFEGYRGDELLAVAIMDRVGLIESKRLASL